MEFVLPLVGFVIVATGTPGPNNLLLAASGMQFGLRATIPHLMGIHCGVYTIVVLCATGLQQLIASESVIGLALKIFGSVYLLYLAWQIIGFRFSDTDPPVLRPLSLLQASLFQFTNPKAWFLATTGISIVLPLAGSLPMAVLILCASLATLGTLCNCLWVLLGSTARRILATPGRRRLFNGMLAALTLTTVGLFWISS